MAEALARHVYGMSEVFSRGIAAHDGNAASPQAINVMRDVYQIDIKGHVSMCLTEADVSAAEVIYTMTESHRRYIADKYLFAQGKLFTINKDDISDPFMQGFDVYAACAAEIKGCLEKLYGIAN
jgi:protein-tyrosine phosphatase